MAHRLLVLCGTSVLLALLIIACEDFNSNNKIQAPASKGNELPAVMVAEVRVRPILVTAITTILGMLPMALSHTEGAELRSPMAISVASGLLFSTFLTVFVIPIAYSIANRVSYKKKP